MNVDHDVVIVGGGPVGATLANLLASLGVDTLVVEREAEIYRLPRAIHFDGECMRVFQAIGIADELTRETVVSPGMKFVDREGRLMIDWSRPTDIGPQGWHPSYRFHQPALETTLRRRLLHREGATLQLSQDVVAVEARDDHVSLRVVDRATGESRSITAGHVVGCDGARSLVRRAMASRIDDLDSHERWLVVDVILAHERPDLGDHSIQYCDPARPTTYVRGVGARRRWEFMLFPDEDAVAMTRPESVWRLLARWVRPDEAVIERPAAYTFHAMVVRGWRRGRLLIAGDAAHQTPPFMGQGLCAGIRDASNLAWKLARVIAGEADDALLSTYESERRPHVREFVETAVRLGRIIQAAGDAPAEARAAHLIERPQVFSTPQPRLGPGAHDDDGPAGTLGEQGWTADGTRLDDVVGYRDALVVDPRHAAVVRQRVADAVVVPADSSSLRSWLDRLGAIAVAVRPDRYIARVANHPSELDDLVDRFAAGRRAQPSTAT